MRKKTAALAGNETHHSGYFLKKVMSFIENRRKHKRKYNEMAKSPILSNEINTQNLECY